MTQRIAWWDLPLPRVTSATNSMFDVFESEDREIRAFEKQYADEIIWWEGDEDYNSFFDYYANAEFQERYLRWWQQMFDRGHAFDRGCVCNKCLADRGFFHVYKRDCTCYSCEIEREQREQEMYDDRQYEQEDYSSYTESKVECGDSKCWCYTGTKRYRCIWSGQELPCYKRNCKCNKQPSLANFVFDVPDPLPESNHECMERAERSADKANAEWWCATHGWSDEGRRGRRKPDRRGRRKPKYRVIGDFEKQKAPLRENANWRWKQGWARYSSTAQGRWYRTVGFHKYAKPSISNAPTGWSRRWGNLPRLLCRCGVDLGPNYYFPSRLKGWCERCIRISTQRKRHRAPQYWSSAELKRSLSIAAYDTARRALARWYDNPTPENFADTQVWYPYSPETLRKLEGSRRDRLANALR